MKSEPLTCGDCGFPEAEYGSVTLCNRHGCPTGTKVWHSEMSRKDPEWAASMILFEREGRQAADRRIAELEAERDYIENVGLGGALAELVEARSLIDELAEAASKLELRHMLGEHQGGKDDKTKMLAVLAKVEAYKEKKT